MEENKKVNNNFSSTGCFIAIIIWGIFIFMLFKLFTGWWDGLGDNSKQSNNSKDYKIEAYVMSQDFMKDYLKSPSTAKFPMYSAINVIQTDNRYKVEAYVDSQNSFGATVRNRYYMILERSNDGGWSKISCDIK